MKNPMPNLYSKATPEMLAAASVNASLRGDFKDIDQQGMALAGAPALFDRYRNRRNSLMMTSVSWANACLRIKVDQAILSAGIVSGLATAGQIEVLHQLSERSKSQLSALYLAMAKVAEDYGLKIDLVHRLAEAELEPPLELTDADESEVTQITALLRNMVM